MKDQVDNQREKDRQKEQEERERLMAFKVASAANAASNTQPPILLLPKKDSSIATVKPLPVKILVKRRKIGEADDHGKVKRPSLKRKGSGSNTSGKSSVTEGSELSSSASLVSQDSYSLDESTDSKAPASSLEASSLLERSGSLGALAGYGSSSEDEDHDT